MPFNYSSFVPEVDRSPLVPERVVAQRYDRTMRTIQRWRAEGYGPPFIRIGGSVFYREADIIAFENSARRGGGAGK